MLKHSVRWAITPHLKQHPLFFTKPSLNMQTVQAPLGSLVYCFPILFPFRDPALKIRFFTEPPKYYYFFTLNPISSVKSLKVTKFLVKILSLNS